MRTKLLIGPVLLLPVLAAAGTGVWFEWFRTYHLVVVTPGILYRDGNRDLREFTHAVAKSHAKTVVTLVDDRELADPAKPQFAAEAAWCAANGVRQIRIPVKLGGWPTTADVRKFLDIANDPASQPVLVHCAQGVRRTGMFVAAYQLTARRESPAEVKSEIQRFGHSPNDTADIETFIDRFNPVARTIPDTMPQSSAE
jgi:protein tyrosine phosphatase (PTP) superfamily phosphohydrolase (DUF442 family)